MKKFLYDEIANRWLKDYDSVWLYSDTHFSDVESYELRGLLKVPDDLVFAKEQGDSKPYDLYVEERIKVLDEEQIKRINSKAGRNSCLIILGDVGNLECVKKLKARYKILIMGNHDKGASNYKRQTITTDKLVCWRVEFKGIVPPLCLSKEYSIDEVKEILITKLNELSNIKSIVPVYEQEDNHLFDEVYEGPVMINDRVILSHEPVFAGVPYFYNIHGHKHDKNYKGDSHHLNCCAEAINYTPINLLNLFKKGLLKDINSIHRMTIDTATARKRRK